MRWLSMLCVVLVLCTCPARAVSPEEVLESQEDALGIEEVEREAQRQGGSAVYGESLDQGLEGLIETGKGEMFGIVRTGVRSAVILFLILLLCGVVQTVYDAGGGDEIPAVSLAGALAVTVAAVSDMNALLGLGSAAVERMTAFSTVLLPVVAGATAATGAIAGAAARQVAAAGFSALLMNLVQRVLVPLVYAYVAASVAWAAVGNPGLRQMAGWLKWVASTILVVVMMVFVGYLSMSGVVSGSVDAMSMKVAKFAISGAIPVVGGILSDASETILASAGILRSSVGVFGMVTILGICLIPVLQLLVHYLLYKLVAALAATMGQSRVCGLVEQIGGAFGLIMGMTGACALLLLVSLVSSVSAVSG